MRLAAKLVVAFVLGIMLLTAVYGYLAVEREIAMLEDDMRRDANWYAGFLMRAVAASGRFRDDEIAQTLADVESYLDATTESHVFDAHWKPLSQQGQGNSATLSFGSSNSQGEPELPHAIWTDSAGVDKITYYYPANFTSVSPGVFELTASRAEMNDYTSETIYRTVGLMAGMALVGGLLMALLGVTQVGKPLEQLLAKTRRVASGDLSDPVELRGFDELSELADSLNLMCVRLQESQDEAHKEAQSRIEALEQLRHADRLKTVGRLAAGMAHELGTPLSVVSGRASLIASGKLAAEDVEKSAETIKSESDRMAKTIRQLLDFARHSHSQRARADLRHVIQQTVDLLQPLAGKRNISLVSQLSDVAAEASFDVGQVQQVLTNLIVNAMQSMSEAGTVQVELDRINCARPTGEEHDGRPPHESEPANYFRIQVIDQGSGISAEDLPQLFEPFFTTKSQGQGTGLGLSISYGIVHEHGGWIDVQSTLGKGSTFAVHLPAHDQEPAAP
ncbi:MAG: HAMP domain-containing histidine kinase [Pirellulales bacterium]|nr:HAMP domain-containing histidine kinase [Pirellulales bacterium]